MCRALSFLQLRRCSVDKPLLVFCSAVATARYTTATGNMGVTQVYVQTWMLLSRQGIRRVNFKIFYIRKRIRVTNTDALKRYNSYFLPDTNTPLNNSCWTQTLTQSHTHTAKKPSVYQPGSWGECMAATNRKNMCELVLLFFFLVQQQTFSQARIRSRCDVWSVYCTVEQDVCH